MLFSNTPLQLISPSFWCNLSNGVHGPEDAERDGCLFVGIADLYLTVTSSEKVWDVVSHARLVLSLKQSQSIFVQFRLY